ncbi:hypothetical protein ANN_04106 [Periplaneta americana]|uniref:Uncharacterized protein n=1 Tax=Periplaneta americana TaxID=6978 RepID=A0ABQ8T975_PERAM|nr:hypothetical protein ANN_04106 [Periplaneta americana]
MEATGVAQSVKALAGLKLRSGVGSIPAWADYLVGFFSRFSPTVSHKLRDKHVGSWNGDECRLTPENESLTAEYKALKQDEDDVHSNGAFKFSQHSMVQFLAVEGVSPIEIHRPMKKMYVDNCMLRARVYEWTKRYQQGRTSLEDGRPKP